MEIIVENLTKEFDKNEVLKDVNLKLAEGKIYGFVGRNGSGKSVLFKVMCGFYKPTKGRVLIDEIDINKNESFLPDARVLIEKPTFLPDISGLENLKLLASIQNKISEKEINDSLDLVNLTIEERNKKYHKYSLGMKQKLAIAQVLMEDPTIMIFDEPFNGIEEKTRDSLKKIISNLKKNKIIIIASHMKEDIVDLCDEIYKIDSGIVTKINDKDKL